MWQAFNHTDEENTRWAWLRAVEWASWPLFMSQPVVPVLLYFYRWQLVLVATLIVSLAWSVFIVPHSVAPRLATAGVFFVRLKVIAVPAIAYLLWRQGRTPIAVVALLWPLLGPLVAGWVMMIPLALFSLTPLGRAAQVGIVQRRFLVTIGAITLGDYQQ